MKAITNIWLLLAPVLAFAQSSMEIIQLRNRSAEQVIPVLQPLLAPGGALSGQGYQLIVRTSPDNLVELRSVLAAIDQPQKRLMVSVRFDNAADASRLAADGAVRITNQGPSGAAFGVESSRSAGNQSTGQQVQVLDGGRAYISTGQVRIYSETATGFDVVPRLTPGGVTLEIYAQQENYARGGTIQGQRASTVVSGRVGDWIELGGTDTASAASSGGGLSTRQAQGATSRRMWLKVEEIR